LKQQGKKKYFHGIVNPTVNSDGSIAWRYVTPRDLTSKQAESAKRWARKVVDLALGVRINPISPKDRRHI
jgi:hypothetical protein